MQQSRYLLSCEAESECALLQNPEEEEEKVTDMLENPLSSSLKSADSTIHLDAVMPIILQESPKLKGHKAAAVADLADSYEPAGV